MVASDEQRRWDVGTLVSLYASGLSCARVGDQLGIGSSTVHRYLRNAGVRLRQAVKGVTDGS